MPVPALARCGSGQHFAHTCLIVGQHEVILIMIAMISGQLIRDVSGICSMELSGVDGPWIRVAVT